MKYGRKIIRRYALARTFKSAKNVKRYQMARVIDVATLQAKAENIFVLSVTHRHNQPGLYNYRKETPLGKLVFGEKKWVSRKRFFCERHRVWHDI